MNAVVAKHSELSAAKVGSIDMAQILDQRSWTLCNDPFPHIRAENVFTAATYRELAVAFDTILSGCEWPAWRGAGFRRNMPGYDASAVDLDGSVGWPFSLFVSRPWHDLFARLFSIDAVRCVSGALHHHAIGSGDGFVHNDLNPGWFVDTGGEEIAILRSNLCHYRSGAAPPNANVIARETIRGVAVIYFLTNSEWRHGDGGETGLYRCERDKVEHAVVNVPPLNNSLVAFECTPTSFHTFRKNHRHPRNSVIVWLHQNKETAVARWGESAIVRWP